MKMFILCLAIKEVNKEARDKTRRSRSENLTLLNNTETQLKVDYVPLVLLIMIFLEAKKQDLSPSFFRLVFSVNFYRDFISNSHGRNSWLYI